MTGFFDYDPELDELTPADEAYIVARDGRERWAQIAAKSAAKKERALALAALREAPSVAAVTRCINALATAKDDWELAHRYDDAIRGVVLHAVAGGHPDAVGIAHEALRSDLMGLKRWYS